jgi:hypothetical protein
LQVNAAEFEHNAGKYLALVGVQDIFITRNGECVAKLCDCTEDRTAMAKSLFGIIPDVGINTPCPKIYMVKPYTNFTVDVFFDDGRIKLYDAKPLIEKGGIFAPLGDTAFFMERCVVLNNTLAWDTTGSFDPTECLDVCPDLIYENALDVTSERRAVI